MGWTVIVSEEKGAILRSETMYFIEIFAIAFLLFVCMTITPLLLRRDYQYRETKELLTQEKKLRESEVRYKELFESVHVGIAVYEAIQDGNDFIFKDFNEGGEKIDRVKRGDIIGKKVTEAFPGVAEFGLLDVFGRVWKTGNSEHHPVGIYKDQRIFGWRENYVYKLPSGEIVAVYDDVTAQKEAEDALGRAEENFRRSLDDSPLGVRIVTTEGETVYANRAILEIYGYDSIEELRTTPVKKRYTPESYAGFQIRKKKRQRGENVPSEYEISILRKNGEVRHLQVFRKEVLWDGERQFQTIYQDITERKRAEEALRQSEERYRTVGETIPYGVWVTDPIGYCTYVSYSFLELVGMTMEQVQQFGWLQLLPPEDVEPTKKHWLHCVQTGEHFEREHRFRTKDGSYRHVLAIGRPVRGEQSQITSWVGINLDITERKQAEEEQKRLLAELEAKNREMEAFVYTVSHDLKAPLVSLNGFSSVLQKECYNQLGEEGKHYLERIQANVAHMDALIRNLLELSRIGLVVVPIEEIDVAALLREIRDELAVRLEEATAEVVVQAPLPTVRADRGRFRQVFANLMDNAVKFRSTERALRIEVGCRQEGDFYRFHVADNGIGIAPQYHEQIFVPFRKLHPEIEGVGMGLALVEKIVEHHGGRIWVESEAGKGSTFYFTIPRG
jgi:PAS domain S-box-containing protein